MRHSINAGETRRAVADSIDEVARFRDPKTQPIFRISNSVGAGGQNLPQDVQATKRALAWAGFYPSERAQVPTVGAGLEEDPDFQRGILRFQRNRDLRRDALLLAGGETERALGIAIRPLIESRKTSTLRQTGIGGENGKNNERNKTHESVAGQSNANPRPGESATEPRKRTDVPTILKETERRKAILEGRPARFPITNDSKATGAIPQAFEIHSVGRIAVLNHNTIIEEEAKKQGVDPDLVRAIVYVENARGWYDNFLPSPSSVRPTNINPTLWKGLGGINPKNAHDPRINIRAGVQLIKRIAERVDDPSPRVIASLWHFLGREKTSKDEREFQARVNYVFENKIWEKERIGKHEDAESDSNLAP